MQIKGINVENLFTIHDNTPGQATLCSIIMLIFFVCLVYEIVFLLWSKKKTELLLSYKASLISNRNKYYSKNYKTKEMGKTTIAESAEKQVYNVINTNNEEIDDVIGILHRK